jgi:hypothetical protein
MNENQNQAQTNNQSSNEATQAYTIVNGKRVTIEQAQAAMKAAEAQVTQTGVTDQHSNHSEPVQTGQTAQSSASAQQNNAAQTQQARINPVNNQSAQAHMEQHINQAQNQGQGTPTGYGANMEESSTQSASVKAMKTNKKD